MKLLTLFLFLTSTSLMADEIAAKIRTVYVPDGYDSNDTSEVFMRGYFTNACLKNPKYKMRKKGRVIQVKVYGVKDDTRIFCPQSIVPFAIKIDIDQLPANEYTLVFNPKSNSPRKRVLDIDKADPSETELYAKVRDIKVEGDYLFIRAQNPGNCFDLDEIEILDNDRKTYTVIPKLVRNERAWKRCITNPRSVVFKRRFRNTLKVEKALFHVWSQDETSLNKIIEF